MATGLALTAFGGGAMVATPINEFLLDAFFQLPTYLGTVDQVQMVTEAGKRFAEVGGQLKEVVVATATDLKHVPASLAAEPGVYVVGTGNSGAARTFMTLGTAYFASMCAGAMMQRVPADNWKPAGWTPPTANDAAAQMVATKSVHYNTALKTPQFYFLWGAVVGNAITGVTVISCAKTLMNDIFGSALPLIVTGGFAATYVAALSGSNMIGRLGWANLSDFTGRKNMYYLFGLGVPICIAIPTLTNMVVTHPGVTPLVAFYGSTALLVSFYGGTFSVLPAYIADIFGPKHCGAIHGRLLTAWSAAAIGGPSILTFFRSRSYNKAVDELAAKVDPQDFQDLFGAPMSELHNLVATKTVTINQLMELVPEGTLDPTPALYNDALYSMAGVLAMAMVCNAMMRPVDPKFQLKQ